MGAGPAASGWPRHRGRRRAPMNCPSPDWLARWRALPSRCCSRLLRRWRRFPATRRRRAGRQERGSRSGAEKMLVPHDGFLLRSGVNNRGWPVQAGEAEQADEADPVPVEAVLAEPGRFAFLRLGLEFLLRPARSAPGAAPPSRPARRPPRLRAGLVHVFGSSPQRSFLAQDVSPAGGGRFTGRGRAHRRRLPCLSARFLHKSRAA